ADAAQPFHALVAENFNRRGEEMELQNAAWIVRYIHGSNAALKNVHDAFQLAVSIDKFALFVRQTEIVGVDHQTHTVHFGQLFDFGQRKGYARGTTSYQEVHLFYARGAQK